MLFVKETLVSEFFYYYLAYQVTSKINYKYHLNIPRKFDSLSKESIPEIFTPNHDSITYYCKKFNLFLTDILIFPRVIDYSCKTSHLQVTNLHIKLYTQ